MARKAKIKFGDYVRTNRHGYMGRAYKIERLTPEHADWIRAQSIQPTLEEILGDWVGILCHDGGAVLSPISSCVKIPRIKGFNHVCAKEYFK